MSEPHQCDQAEEEHSVAAEHLLAIWTSLTPGNIVSIRGLDPRDHVGTVESKTRDGPIIWVRDDLNERRLFHFPQCISLRFIQ
jgi:hypothetical protein